MNSFFQLLSPGAFGSGIRVVAGGLSTWILSRVISLRAFNTRGATMKFASLASAVHWYGLDEVLEYLGLPHSNVDASSGELLADLSNR